METRYHKFITKSNHYENLPMEHTEVLVKLEKIFDIFNMFVQNIDCGYTLEPPRRGGSNKYPQSMFWIKTKKNRYTPAKPSFSLKKVRLNGEYIPRTCFPDDCSSVIWWSLKS